MWKDSLEQFKNQLLGKKSERIEVQPCIVKFTYTKKEEPDRLYNGHTFCRDLNDGLIRAKNCVAAEKGDVAKIWLCDLTAADPTLDLVVGVCDADDKIPIDDDRVLKALYANYRKEIKDPQKARAERSKTNATRYAQKPRIRAKPATVEPKEPTPTYKPYDVVLASQYKPPEPAPIVKSKALAPVPAIGDSMAIDPWDEYGAMYD